MSTAASSRYLEFVFGVGVALAGGSEAEEHSHGLGHLLLEMAATGRVQLAPRGGQRTQQHAQQLH